MSPSAGEPPRRYVLVADGDRERALSRQQIIAARGGQSELATDGAAALQILERRGPPVLVLVDLSLPGIDALELVAELRKRSTAEESPAIVFAASDELRAHASSRREELGIAHVLSDDTPAAALGETIQPFLQWAGGDPGGSSIPDRAVHGSGPEASSIDQVIKAALTEFRSAFGAKGAVIYVKAGNLERVQSDLAGTDAAADRLHGDGWLFQGLLRGGETFILPDQAPPSLLEDGGFKVNSPRGFVGIPLTTSRAGLVGAIGLFDTEKLQFDAQELDAFRAMARRLSASLDSHISGSESPVQPQEESILIDEEYFRRLSRLALSDSLTGLANRRGGELAIQREVARSRRERAPLSFVLIDVDDFKQWNDHYGHVVGDEALRSVAKLIGSAGRGSDLAIRWGGEEFLLVLPSVTSEGALVVAERLRAQIESSGFGERPLTISAGVAELQAGEEVSAVMARADAKLSQAKLRGRNRVVV